MTCTGCGVFQATADGGLCRVCEATPPERRPNHALAIEAERWNAEAAALRQRKRTHRPQERAA